MEKILLRNIENPRSADIKEYIKNGGYKDLLLALKMQPGEIIEEVKRSGLRGRGGSGFPTGLKWEVALRDPKSPKYLICNADEGEPGTFKDRLIMEKNPHLLIEGMIIAGYAIKAEYGYIYLRGEYPYVKKILSRTIKEAYDKGYLGEDIMGRGVKFHIKLYQGAGAYICGEETALIESIEGKRGQPRIKPPFPASTGVWGMPSVVNNVETLSNIPYIIEIGATAYLKIGTPECPGPKLYCVSGHVKRPGVYELPMGTTLREIIYTHAGGVRDGKRLKAVIPGGISTPILPPQNIDCTMDFVNMPRYGSALGSGAIIVMDETVCLLKVCERALRFFAHESCGKCTPCRIGTKRMLETIQRILRGAERDEDIESLLELGSVMDAASFCPLGQTAPNLVISTINHFREEFESHIKEGRCPS
ncbi:MAG: NADH-quinone oxidoreductase subunit NuoF [Nitrospirota bacterium]|jgi:NADH-quinone oxidoreductase subunit F